MRRKAKIGYRTESICDWKIKVFLVASLCKENTERENASRIKERKGKELLPFCPTLATHKVKEILEEREKITHMVNETRPQCALRCMHTMSITDIQFGLKR